MVQKRSEAGEQWGKLVSTWEFTISAFRLPEMGGNQENWVVGLATRTKPREDLIAFSHGTVRTMIETPPQILLRSSNMTLYIKH